MDAIPWNFDLYNLDILDIIVITNRLNNRFKMTSIRFLKHIVTIFWNPYKAVHDPKNMMTVTLEFQRWLLS